jgi:polyisoprenoid-binding protein YceI
MSIETTHGASGVAENDLVPGNYRLDPARTSVTFTAKKFGIFTIRGSMDLESGEFTVGQRLEESSLHVVLDAGSFKTPMARRDEHVKSKTFLHTAEFPHIEFGSTEVDRTNQGWQIRGLLSVRGQKAPVVLSVSSVEQRGGLVQVHATAQVNRKELGVTALPPAASTLLDVTIDATGTPVARADADANPPDQAIESNQPNQSSRPNESSEPG